MGVSSPTPTPLQSAMHALNSKGRSLSHSLLPSSPTQPHSDLGQSAATTLASLASEANSDQAILPLKTFVHEVLQQSRTSGNILQTALCNLENLNLKSSSQCWQNLNKRLLRLLLTHKSYSILYAKKKLQLVLSMLIVQSLFCLFFSCVSFLSPFSLLSMQQYMFYLTSCDLDFIYISPFTHHLNTPLRYFILFHAQVSLNPQPGDCFQLDLHFLIMPIQLILYKKRVKV